LALVFASFPEIEDLSKENVMKRIGATLRLAGFILLSLIL
jgi:hypothetical protein